MLNSTEHEILNAHRYKTIKKFRFCQSQISPECYLSFFTHVKMPIFVDMYEQGKFHAQLS